MRIINTISVVSLLAGAALAAPKAGHHNKKDPWKYAGEDHGVRFFFQPEAKGGIRIKIENSMDAQVDVMYRVMDTDWKKTFASSLAPHAADSTIRYRPEAAGRNGVRYPYFDQVFLQRVDGAASVDAEPARNEAPGRT